MKLVIQNRSLWPDWWVKPISQWIARRAGIYDLDERRYGENYTLQLVGIKRTDYFAGRAYGRTRCRVRIHRRFTKKWPYTTKYWKYKWSFSYQLFNRLEAFVDIVAHEMFHATGGHRSNYTKDGRIDRATMEMACERFAKETVEEFRKEWKTLLRPRVIQAAAEMKRKPQQTRRSDPDNGLVKAQNMLATWQRKAKLAATKIRKYRQRVRYYEGRVAAKEKQ